jgi:hypothetical protein
MKAALTCLPLALTRTSEITRTVEWIASASALPDDDTLVMLALNDDDVWLGYRDGDTWQYVNSMTITSERVTHWMPLPAPPATASRLLDDVQYDGLPGAPR